MISALQATTGICQSQVCNDLDIAATLGNDVFADDANVGDAVLNILWNVIVAKRKDLKREIFGEPTAAFRNRPES